MHIENLKTIMEIPSLRIPSLADWLVGELAEEAEWVILQVDQCGRPWTLEAQKVQFRKRDVWILPLMRNYFPALAVRRIESESLLECDRLLRQTLSNLAWVLEAGFIPCRTIERTRPIPDQGNPQFAACQRFDLSYFPDTDDAKTLLAIALMREARSLNHPGYAFLSFYRVLERCLPDSGKHKCIEFMRINLANMFSHVTSVGAKLSLDKLKGDGLTDEEIAKNLYEASRCAIAHANHGKIYDPDAPEDSVRFYEERPIIEELARRAIEKYLHYDSPRTARAKNQWKKDLLEEAKQAGDIQSATALEAAIRANPF